MEIDKIKNEVKRHFERIHGLKKDMEKSLEMQDLVKARILKKQIEDSMAIIQNYSNILKPERSQQIFAELAKEINRDKK